MSGQVCGVVYSLLFVFKHNQLALRPRNSYILTVWILHVFTGVCPRCSRASWYKGWEPSAEFNIVSCSYSDWLVCCILFSFSLFFFLLTNNLGVVSRHSSSAKQSQAGWAVGTREASLQPVQARLPCRGVAEHLQNSAASASCDEEPEQPGPVLHPSNQPRSRTQTWLLSVLLTNCQ